MLNKELEIIENCKKHLKSLKKKGKPSKTAKKNINKLNKKIASIWEKEIERINKLKEKDKYYSG